MSHDKSGEPLSGPDPLETQDLGYEDRMCEVCGVPRYFHYQYVPFHMELTCQVCGWKVVA